MTVPVSYKCQGGAANVACAQHMALNQGPNQGYIPCWVSRAYVSFSFYALSCVFLMGVFKVTRCTSLSKICKKAQRSNEFMTFQDNAGNVHKNNFGNCLFAGENSFATVYAEF